MENADMSYRSTENNNRELVEDELRDIPRTVIETLKLDDTSIQYGEDEPLRSEYSYLTFRYFLLSVIFVVPGAFIDTMNSYRTTSAEYSILFVQFLCHPMGLWLAKVLPRKEINIGKYSFNLNPGPWSIKEAVLVTLTAASGATGNQGTAGISLAKVFYNEDVPMVVALLFMWAIVWTGYSYGAIARNFVLYDPQFVWPKALMQTSLFKLQEGIKVEELKTGPVTSASSASTTTTIESTSSSSSQLKIFGYALAGMFVWEFLPEFFFPMTSSLAILCWIRPHNYIVNFIGSGLGGMGVLNISLDWSNITSSVMLSPYWTIVLQFIGYALSCWLLVPIFKWSYNGQYSMGLMENRLLLSNGTIYPTLKLMTDDLKFNETAYELYGPPHLGAQRVWNIFFDYAAYTSALTWILLFGFKDLKRSFLILKKRMNKTSVYPESSDGQSEDSSLLNVRQAPLKRHAISSHYSDKINKAYSIYEDVPNTWYLILFTMSFVSLSCIFLSGSLFLQWKIYLVALIFGGIIVIPMSYLFAISNFQLAIGTVNELIYGALNQTDFFSNSKRHPVGASIYGAVAGNAWYRCQYILQDQKIGVYNQIPPKAVFFSQIFGDLIGVPFNYISLRWVLSSKYEYLSGKATDPLHQWTGQLLINYNTNAVQYVLMGPKRFFANYPIIPWGIGFGLVAPFIVFFLNKLNKRYFPRIDLKCNLWNTTIIFSAMSKFYGNISTGYFTQFLIGTFTMFYLFRYRHNYFKNYNYILAAAFDTGFNLAMLALFVLAGNQFLHIPSHFVNWWGNDSLNIEKCYAL